MSTVTQFGNEIETEPGAYSQINGAGTPSSAIDTYGVVLLIDTGIGAGFTGGGSVNGQLTNGAAALQDFYSPLDMKRFFKGGILFDLVDYLWSPSNNGAGPQKVSFIKAATTTCASIVLPLKITGGSTVINSITLQALNEGTFGNGVYNAPVLTGGYGVKIKSGILNPAAFIIEFYEGQYQGLDSNNVPYGLTLAQLIANGQNNAIYTSAEFTGFLQLIALLNADNKFNKLFKISSTLGTDFTFDSTILVSLPGINLFSGGTCVYNATDVDATLTAIIDTDNDAFLCLDYDIDQTPQITSFVSAPVLTAGAPIGSGGSGAFSAGGTFFWVLTALNAAGETVKSNEVTATIGTNGSITFTWPAVAFETAGYRLYRGTVTNTENTYFSIAHGTLTFTDTGAAGTSRALPTINTASYLAAGSQTPGYNKGALATANVKILNYVLNQSKYTEKMLYIGGNSLTFDAGNGGFGTLQIAQYYNSPLAITVDSGIKMPSNANDTSLFFTKPSLYTAAMACGRINGLRPMVPGTYKDVRISGLTNPLSEPDRVRALTGGVLHFKKVGTSWVINQSINSMQPPNGDIVDTAGNSSEISVMRVKHQLNKELVINATPLFTGQNLYSASDADVLAFTLSFLQDRTVIPNKLDNYIMAYKNVVVGQSNGKKSISYCFQVNEPVNQTLFTGTMYDSRVTF